MDTGRKEETGGEIREKINYFVGGMFTEEPLEMGSAGCTINFRNSPAGLYTSSIVAVVL